MTDHAREVLDAIQKIRCLVAESTGRALNLTTDNARLAEILAASRDDLLARIESTQERAVKAEQRNRKAAQLLIEKIGASGPEGVDETATRAVAALASAESQLAAAERKVGELNSGEVLPEWLHKQFDRERRASLPSICWQRL